PHGRAAELAVHVAGRGPLAVLVHGYPLDHRMWLDQLHGPLAASRTLCAIDLRGHGASGSSGDPVHTMELLASDVAAVIRSLADGPVDVVGLSMGGYATFALWAAAPQLVRSLVLANTRAVPDSAAARVGRDASIATVLDKGRTALADGMLKAMLAPGADALVVARLRTMIEATPIETILADLRGLKDRPDRMPMLHSIAVPALVIAGDRDPIAPVAESQAMAAAIPGARLVVVLDSAHLSPMENPVAFASAVGSFWGR
ncbi:MAG: alpha/beta hydrolase, partial [Planctomycetota bacterium]